MLVFTIFLTVQKYPSKIVFAFFNFNSGKIFYYVHCFLFLMVPQTVEVRVILRSVTRQFMLQGPHVVQHIQFTPCRVQIWYTQGPSQSLIYTGSFTELAWKQFFIPPVLEEREKESRYEYIKLQTNILPPSYKNGVGIIKPCLLHFTLILNS